MKWGILYALPQEGATMKLPRAPILEPFTGHDGQLFIRSGMGEANAAQAARLLIDAGAEALLSWGTCAALNNSLHCGDLVTATSINDESCPAILSPEQLEAFKRIPFSHTSASLCSPSQKQALREASNACAADMESLAISTTAREHTLPYLILRAVSDDCHTSLPDYLNEVISENGELSIAALLTKALTHPKQWKVFFQMCRGGQQALGNLRTLWPEVAQTLRTL